MKNFTKSIVLCLAMSAIIFSSQSFSQTTAVNFNCDDCHGVTHDLFSELDAGKVIVIAWVMPCGGCINGALSAYAAVQNYASSNPGEVLFYIVDDYGNTNCSSLGAWAENNGMTDFTPFSNALISMADYGEDGMPKVIVLGGNSHTVFYNANNSDIDAVNISNAISSALSGASLNELNQKKELVVYPNPGTADFSINIEALGIQSTDEVNIVLKNIAGDEVSHIFKGKWNANQPTIQFNTAHLSAGTYFVHCTDQKTARTLKIVISH
ncbi:MAG: T9SS type A sorting domain-containing protein [Bacteroidota bacterium]